MENPPGTSDSRRAALISLGLGQQSPAAAHPQPGLFAWGSPGHRHGQQLQLRKGFNHQ